MPQINIAHPTKDDFWKMEVAQMLEKPIPESEHVNVYQLKGVPMAAFLEFKGAHEWQKVEEALVGFLTWVEENGYRTVGPLRQVYLEMSQGYGEGVPCVIELQIPVRLAGHQKT